jgi:YVTN family beta-propeller protein
MHARRDHHQAGTGHRGGVPARWRGAAVGATVIAAAALALAAGAVPASAAGGYTVTATIAVGSYPQGVAVDPAAGTAYVTNGGGTVSVIDAATSAVTATLTVGTDPDAVVDPGSRP